MEGEFIEVAPNELSLMLSDPDLLAEGDRGPEDMRGWDDPVVPDAAVGTLLIKGEFLDAGCTWIKFQS